ncbi:hypothetical protein DFH09DRAFT_1359192 [Mycena vulgaris]|nr:hypothetical protein DFH09DRAFT_1359192 [Mycena vulgaris]
MHASLCLSNMEQLPDTLQALAMSAARGSLNDLEALYRLIPDSPQAYLPLFIPVFYVNLSPGQLPDPHDANSHDRIWRAAVALEGLSALHKRLVLTAYHDVWSAVWDFIQFLDEYDQHHRDASRGPIYVLFLTTMFSLSDDVETSDMINTTPRVRVFFIKGWAAAVKDGQMTDHLFRDIASFLLHRLELSGPNSIKEVIEGAGGSLDDLAPLIINYLPHFVPHRNHTMSNGDSVYVLAAFILIARFDDGKDATLNQAFAEHGMAGCLATVLCALCGSPSGLNPENLIDLCVSVLVTNLNTFPGFSWVKEAFDAGLLRGIVLVASRDIPTLQRRLAHLIRDISAPSLTYHSVLSSLSRALDEANLHISPAFKTSATFNVWTDFVNLASQRLELLRKYDGGLLTLRRACDNLEAHLLEEVRTEALRRCTARKSAFYCSRPCQGADWKAGHRQLCPSASAQLSPWVPIFPEDGPFMRALLHHDYEAARADILARLIRFADVQPGTPMFVKFDYLVGRMAFVVGPVDVSTGFGVRVAWSNGRVDLHVMPEGGARHFDDVFVHPAHWICAMAPFHPLLIQELIDHCIQFIRDSPSDLKACSLVSKSWACAAQRLLFWTVSLRSPTMTRRGSVVRLDEILGASPHLIQCIHRLDLDRDGRLLQRVFSRDSEAFSSICNLPLPLEHVCISDTHLSSTPDLQRLFSLPTLRRVELSGTFNDPAAFLEIWDHCSPNLKHLHLRCWNGSSDPVHPIRRGPPIFLESLRLDREGVDNWLTHDLCQFDFSCLLVLALNVPASLVAWKPMIPGSIKALSFTVAAIGHTIDLAPFANLTLLRVHMYWFSHQVALTILDTLAPSSHLRKIALSFANVPNEAVCEEIDSRIADLRIQHLPIVELEMPIAQFTQSAPYFSRSISRNMLRRIDPTRDWFDDCISQPDF